jgi:hypothetical protein
MEELDKQREAAEQYTAQKVAAERLRQNSMKLDADWAAAERLRLEEAAALAEDVRAAAAAGAAACG